MRTRRCLRVFLFALGIGVALPILPARADIPGLSWGDPEIVDLGVSDVSDPSGASAAHTPSWIPWGQGEWHVVYVKQDRVYHCVRTDSGWQAPEPLSSNGVIARDPHLAFGGGYLHVVWEDARTGHPEVWARRWDGSTWWVEACRTCDDTPSAHPVIAGGRDRALMVWEEGVTGSTAIRGEEWNGSTWGSLETISQSPAAATEPSVSSASDWLDYHAVTWSDARHGEPEIYLRRRDIGGPWQPEVRLTDLPGACRHSSIKSLTCCGDAINPQVLSVFENDASGVAEVWSACSDFFGGTDVRRLSADDGIPSAGPSAGGFAFTASECQIFGGLGSIYFTSWTDAPAYGTGRYILKRFQGCGPGPESDTLTTQGNLRGSVAAIEGEPQAGVMSLWTADVGGQTALMAIVGSTVGCYREQFDAPTVVLVAPEGIPATVARLIDSCSGIPLPDHWVGLSFSADLDAALTWDPVQAHPDLPEVRTDDQGEAHFGVRGGGCSAEGYVTAWCGSPDWAEYWVEGARSPDVDGDCLVGGNDLEYVTSMLGTSEFCADLDGSGTVDDSDVAIVRATLGDHCSHLASGAEDALADAAPRVTLLSNPCAETVGIRLDLRSPATSSVQICDPGGRLVRDLGERLLPAGSHALSWDTRDAGGHPVASGVYLVRVRSGVREARRSVLVLR